MPGRTTDGLSQEQIIADLRRDRRRMAAALTLVQMPQPAKDTFTVAATPATTYTLSAIPYQGTGGSSLNLSLNGVELLEGVDYTVDYTTAIVTVSATLKGTPTPADVLTADYWTTGDLIAATSVVDTGGFSDNFNRADSTSTLGTDWTTWADGPVGAGQVSTWGISSNRAYCVTSPNISSTAYEGVAYHPCSSGDGTLQLTYAVANGTNTFGGLAFRINTGGGCFLAFYNQLTLVASAGAPGTNLGFYSASFGTGDVMTVVLSGASITVKKNGTTVGTFSNSTNQTSGNHGMFANVPFDAVTRFDDFSFTP